MSVLKFAWSILALLFSRRRHGWIAAALLIPVPCGGLVGCLLPPSEPDSHVLPTQELQLVSRIRRAKDYALGGRLELAETGYRKILRDNPNISLVHNDLGVVLLGQERLTEAEKEFRTAIELDNKNIIAIQNLARLVHAGGKDDESVELLSRSQDLLVTLSTQELRMHNGREFTMQDLVDSYRDLAGAEFAAGRYGEALCWSERAYNAQGNTMQAVQHARILLSLERVNEAMQVLLLPVEGDSNGPVSAIVDLGVALTATKQFDRARDMFQKALVDERLAQRQIFQSRMLKLLSLVELGQVEDAKTLSDILKENSADICKNEGGLSEDYWPLEVTRQLQQIVKRLCSNEHTV